MAVTFPLSKNAFWKKLRFADRPEFVPQHNQKQSADGAGNVMASSSARPKWMVNVVLAGGRHDRNLTQEADLKALAGRDGTFLAYDIRRPYPAFDPGGAILLAAGSVVQVRTKGVNNRSFSLKGLPVGYRITKSDKLSIAYGSNKFFLCAAMEDAIADGSGNTAEFEVWPWMPPNIALNDNVTLIEPCGKFKLLAGSQRPASGQGNISSGIGFSAISLP